MRRLSVLAAVALSLFASLASIAQEAERAPPAAAEERPAPPPAAEDENRTLEEIFIPSEEIAADEEVTFPIDI